MRAQRSPPPEWLALDRLLPFLRGAHLYRADGAFSFLRRGGDFLVGRRAGAVVALRSSLFFAVAGTAAAPMFFEFSFGLIIMARTNPSIPAHPMRIDSFSSCRCSWSSSRRCRC